MVEQKAYKPQLPEIETPHEDSVQWSTVSLSEIFSRDTRLEASVYDIKGKQARETLANCRWQLATIAGENGLAAAYHRGRFKRIFVKNSDFPIFQPSQITEIYPKPYLWISEKTNTNIEALKVKKNQILLSCSGTIGKCTIVSKTLDEKIFSHDLLRISTFSEFDVGYLYAFLKTDIGQILLTTNSYGAVVSHIEPEHLSEIPIPNPQAIVKFEIHDLVMKSFGLRDESNEMIDQAEQLLIRELNLPPIVELKPRYFEDAEVKNFSVNLSEMSSRLEASYHKPIVQTISEHITKYAAEVTTLSDPRISSKIILPSRFKRVYVGQGQGVMFFGGKELLQLTPKSEKFLSLTHHSERIKNELTLQENMIMVTCSGTIGKVAIVPKHWEGWTANQHILRVIPSNNNIAGYIYAWLATDYGKELITRFIYGAVVDEIDHRHLAQVQIPILRDQNIQRKINDLVLAANQKRDQAYLLEQKAIQTTNEKVIYSQ